MKKGDIVKLREGILLTEAALWARGVVMLTQMGVENISTELTVAERGTETVCCSVVQVVRFEEIPGVTFTPGQFEVLLASNEPDVEQLMKQVNKHQLEWVGF